MTQTLLTMVGSEAPGKDECEHALLSTDTFLVLCHAHLFFTDTHAFVK